MRSLTVAAAAALVLLPAAPAWAANGAPVAVDDAVDLRTTIVDAAAQPIDVLANDSDPDGDALTVTAVTVATKGTASIEGGRLMYRPQYRAEGTDSFSYTVTDAEGNSATGTVTARLWVDPGVPSNPSITIPNPGSVTVTWSADPRADRYRIYRDHVLVHTTSALTWTDSGLLDGSTYRYGIAGVNVGGFEGPRQELTRKARLMTPSALAVAPVDDPTALALTWQRNGSAGPWVVYRDGVHVATTNDPRFRDTGLVTGREYGYQVQLVDRPTPLDYDVSPASALTEIVRATPVSLSPIAWLYLQRGGADSDLGAVTVPERAVPGGRQQDHVNGLIVQRNGGRAYAVLHDFATTYEAAGGVSGDLGFPVSSQVCGLRDGGCDQWFEGGSLTSHQNTGTRIVQSEMEAAWNVQNREAGRLGYPIGNEVCGLRGAGCFQDFQGGAIYWSPATGARAVFPPYEDAWARHGSEQGRLGYPTKDEECGWTGACYQQFQGGMLFWTATTGMHAVFTPYADTWGRIGGMGGRLGSPTSDEICAPARGGCYQQFQGGTIYWSAATGAQFSVGSIRDTYLRTGGHAGRLGYPTTSEVCGLSRAGCLQLFQGGAIYWSPASGAHVVLGAIREAWGYTWAQDGRLGYPTSSEFCGLRGAGCFQTFQGGAIYWSPASGAHVVLGAIRETWARQGWETGRLGYPTSSEFCGLRGGGCFQTFQGGAIYFSPASGAHVVLGAIRDTWARQGWETGRLGYPVGGEWFAGGAYRQNFQGGTITIDRRGPRITYR